MDNKDFYDASNAVGVKGYLTGEGGWIQDYDATDPSNITYGTWADSDLGKAEAEQRTQKGLLDAATM